MARAEDLFERLRTQGASVIHDLIRDRQSEELFLDFKRSSDEGRGHSLSQNDRNNLAKAISGFGNSAGGIIVWGVDCRPGDDGADVAKNEVPLQDAKRFKSWLEGAVSGCTYPPHGGVQHWVIETGHNQEGYVVTYIPQSNDAPHQVTGRMQYYMRAGSDFLPVPHQLLAGMFGRRPQPDIVGQWLTAPAQVFGSVVQCQVGYLLRNKGPGIARDIFLDVKVLSAGEPSCKIECTLADQINWNCSFSLGRFCSLMGKPEYRMPPGALAQPLFMTITFSPPFTTGIKIERSQGCDNAVPSSFTVENSASNIEAIYSQFISLHEKGGLTDSDYQNVTGRFLGIEPED